MWLGPLRAMAHRTPRRTVPRRHREAAVGKAGLSGHHLRVLRQARCTQNAAAGPERSQPVRLPLGMTGPDDRGRYQHDPGVIARRAPAVPRRRTGQGSRPPRASRCAHARSASPLCAGRSDQTGNTETPTRRLQLALGDLHAMAAPTPPATNVTVSDHVAFAASTRPRSGWPRACCGSGPSGTRR